jgi:hypothetical protein
LVDDIAFSAWDWCVFTLVEINKNWRHARHIPLRTSGWNVRTTLNSADHNLVSSAWTMPRRQSTAVAFSDLQESR